jgi:hypothetical protein
MEGRPHSQEVHAQVIAGSAAQLGHERGVGHRASLAQSHCSGLCRVAWPAGVRPVRQDATVSGYLPVMLPPERRPRVPDHPQHGALRLEPRGGWRLGRQLPYSRGLGDRGGRVVGAG